MAAGSLLALLDDIATVLDDVATMTKVAAQRTAGVLGDDLALNAQQVAGVRADRELPVVWAVAKGSAKNKLILVPAAIALSALLPWLITPLLMLGGAFLCYEGFEKVAHKFFAGKEGKASEHAALTQAVADRSVDMREYEQNKIKGAIRTDFILSAEIVVIALGTVQEQSILMQSAVVCAIAAIMTIGVYGLVAGIVKLDDAGLALVKQQSSDDWSRFQCTVGRFILWLAPWLMKTLSVVGTIAMFMVGGGILVHGIPGSHDWLHHLSDGLQTISYAGPFLAFLSSPFINVLAGMLMGAVVLGAMTPIAKMAGKHS